MKGLIEKRKLSKNRVRRKLLKSAKYPRLHVYISNKNVIAQIIDEHNASTKVYVTTVNIASLKNKSLTEKASWAAEEIAKKAKTAKMSKVVFDRGYKRYHGRIKVFADKVREKGLKI